MIKLNRIQIFNITLLLVGVLLPYMRVAPWAMILLIIISLFNRRSFSWTKRATKHATFIALPLFCHILFLWNEPNLTEALDPIVRLLSLLLFPLIILGFSRIIKTKFILTWYPIASILILIGLALQFILINPDRIQNYLNGMDLHEPGYAFANSFGSHGPAINMHLSFIITMLFYNLYRDFIQLKVKSYLKLRIFTSLLLVISIILLIMINTRLAILITIINVGLIAIYLNINRYSLKKNLLVTASIALFFIIGAGAYAEVNPAFKTKLSTITFAHMDKVGRLDEVENPEVNIFNALVTRVSIWKTAWALGERNYLTGVGASQSREILTEEYKKTNQQFLYKYKFPVHNQWIDYFVKFGIVGFICVSLYLLHILYISIYAKNVLALCFFLLFFSVNLVDDFLVRFDGIGFSGFWISFFAIYIIQKEIIERI